MKTKKRFLAVVLAAALLMAGLTGCKDALRGVAVACHPAPALRVLDYISPAELSTDTFIAIPAIAMPESVSATTGDIWLAGL